jgi:hypothetical protein
MVLDLYLLLALEADGVQGQAAPISVRAAEPEVTVNSPVVTFKNILIRIGRNKSCTSFRLYLEDI